MKGYLSNIEKETIENNNFRKVLYTAKNSQLALMSLEPGEQIGQEVHQGDQFIRIEQGKGEVILNGKSHAIEEDFAVIVPAGVAHNIINTSNKPLKLYTIYSPPEHKDQTIHATKNEAMADKQDHFDGATTEN